MEASAAADVEVVGVRKAYGTVEAVAGVDLEVGAGTFFTLLGPSGSGKTTTLRLIAGFERPDAGTIQLGGADITGLPPYSRDVNTVFQDYALFPHMTVAENVAYGLRVRKASAARERRKPRRRGARDGAARRVRRPQAGPALRRPAPARRACPRDRQPAAGAAARRAARRARPEAPPGDAARAEGAPARARDHVRLRHPRPGGGADDERPHRRLQPRADRADRHARRGLRAAGERVRRRVRRHVEHPRARRRAASACGRRRSLLARREADEQATVDDVVYVGAFTRYLVDARRGRADLGRAAERDSPGARAAARAVHARLARRGRIRAPGRTNEQEEDHDANACGR